MTIRSRTASPILTRRRSLRFIGSAVVAPMILPGGARAQGTWPVKPVRYINPFPPGGPTDTLSRLYTSKMAELTGQTWIVDNRGGAGGDLGVDVVAKAAPDGYTLGVGGISSHAIAPTLKAGKQPFDPRKDFTFISNIWVQPNMLVTNLGLPVNSVPDLIELLKKNPDKYFYASAGHGTTPQLCGELFKLLAGVDIKHVAYRGSAPAMLDVLSGAVQMMFDNFPTALAQYKPGKVKGLAVTTPKRSLVTPELPPLDEFLPGFDVSSWSAVIGPANLPPAVVDQINAHTKKALESDELKAQFLELGATPWWSTSAEVTAYRASEEVRLADIIRRANITVD